MERPIKIQTLPSMPFYSGETMRFSWDFSDKATGDDVFVNMGGTNFNVVELLQAGRNGRSVLRPNPLNPGTYTACVTVSVGKSSECGKIFANDMS